ncbi:MAG TPA: SGNH/GDSL hydrolase family protein [Coleofasciculaceae cyanobacterium]
MTTKNLYVFGDSLSDTGNFFTFTGGLVPPSPPYFNGRASNGPVAVEQLATRLGSNFSLQQSNNYAFIAATTGQGNSNEDDVGADLPGLLNQIDAFKTKVGTGKADPRGLYIVWAGPNDFIDTIAGSPLPQPTGGTTFADPAVLLQQAALNINHSVSTLKGLGARNFVLPNMLNLGRLPGSQKFPVEATAISKAFNAAVALELDNLQFKVTQVDLFSAGEAAASNPGKFGFTNVTDPLLLAPPGSNPDQFFFWDLYHPTTKGHGLLADTIYQTLKGKIPQPAFNSIAGTSNRDFLVGTSANDVIDGLEGNDSLSGLRGNDRIEGRQGNDKLFGVQGDDTLSGGDGTDFLNGGQGDDIAFGGTGNDQLLGQVGNDILVGDAGKDLILGGQGNDYLLGGEGQDALWGNEGQDIINGGSGKDLLLGGLGNDRLDGGADSDRLKGGLGNDQFVYRPGSGSDVILDFQKGADKIDLTSFRFKSFSNFTSSVTLNGSIINFGNSNTLKVNQVNVSTLSESDFIFA